jgi:cation diffusion facilitator CzcD-associated flavoprotein CzcO
MTAIKEPEYEAIVIGAGVAGIYQIYRLAEMGMRALVLEAGGDVGGTWYWNRYPGARFDSESVTYAYSFSKDLLQEWNWSERFAGQAETERYLRHVVDKFDLRRHMRFNARVKSAVYDEDATLWTLTLETGERFTTRFLITALGLLSTPTLPRYQGMDRFKGRSLHTYGGFKEPVEFKGKRVAVIGTGATGIQVIAAIASEVADLTVYQRRPNWAAPLGNGPISPEEMTETKRSYDEIFARCRETVGGFIHATDPRKTVEVPRAERLAFWEELYHAPGMGIWLGNFRDILYNMEANAELSAFMADKIRQRVRDPALAEKLIPKDHGFGMRRVPLETRYYEVYNRENVHLHDLNEASILEITEDGIRTEGGERRFDIIVYATGFDAITGTFDRIDFIGQGGARLRDKWRDGPLTTYGLMTAGFPNMLTVAGPQSASVGTNFPRGIEEAVDWVTSVLKHMRANGYERIEAKQATEDEWVAEVKHWAGRVFMGNEKSWMTGYNSNLDRDQSTRYLVYLGGALRYRERLAVETDSGYAGFAMR